MKSTSDIQGFKDKCSTCWQTKPTVLSEDGMFMQQQSVKNSVTTDILHKGMTLQ